MSKKITLALVLIALLASCKGGEDEENEGNKTWNFLVGGTKVETTKEYTIMGTVQCAKCKAYDLLWVEVKDEDDVDFYATVWKGQFEEGKFKITAYMYPTKGFLLRVSEGSQAPNGVTKIYIAPEDNTNPVEITFNLDEQ
jgi:hypothetical protein